MTSNPSVRFAVIGMNHSHINGMTKTLLKAGSELVAFYEADPVLAAQYAKAFPQARQARSEAEILEADSVQLIASTRVPNLRPALAIAAMRHGKDFLSDKPGFTTFEQLAQVRAVQAETGRIFAIYFGEHFGSPASIRAAELVSAGAVGRVVQTTGFGPHTANLRERPEWFFKRECNGGILDDIGSHQIYQFLFFTGSVSARVGAAAVANYKYPQHPELEDFGELLLLGDKGTGYFRVDWYTPAGLGSWGDGRLLIQGTEGYIELRKNVDIGGRSGGNHLFLVNEKATQHIDCSSVETPFGRQFLADIVNRTETSMPQSRCFLAAELALQGQAQALRLGHLENARDGEAKGAGG